MTILQRFSAITGMMFWIAAIAILLSLTDLTPDVIKWTGGGFEKDEVYAGEAVTVTRELTASRDVTVTISRAMVREVEGKKHILSLPEFRMVYEKGDTVQVRQWIIPAELSNGNYTLENTACYWEYAIIERCLSAPKLPVTIVSKPE